MLPLIHHSFVKNSLKWTLKIHIFYRILTIPQFKIFLKRRKCWINKANENQCQGFNAPWVIQLHNIHLSLRNALMILLLFGSLGETSSSGPFQSWIPQLPWQETALVIPQFFAKIYLLRKKKKRWSSLNDCLWILSSLRDSWHRARHHLCVFIGQTLIFNIGQVILEWWETQGVLMVILFKVTVLVICIIHKLLEANMRTVQIIP